MKPRILAFVCLADYERWSATHALTALAAVECDGFALDVLAHVQSREARWGELDRLRGCYPHRLTCLYWWGRDIATGPAQHERLAGITASRNVGLAWARRNRYQGLWFVDSDILVPSDALTRLWALDRPLTSGVFWSTEANGVCYVFAKDLNRAERGLDAEPGGGYDCHFLRWLPTEGVVPADFTGAGCLLWRGAALASDLTFRYGWREQDRRHWAEDPFCLLDALDMGLGPVHVECSTQCWHTRPDGLAVRRKEVRPTAEILAECGRVLA